MSDERTTSTPFSGAELKDLLKQFAQPVLDSFDARVRDEVSARVQEQMAETPSTLDDRLTVLERAVADLHRSVEELRQQLGTLDASAS